LPEAALEALLRLWASVGARRGAHILVDYLKKLDSAGILHVPDPIVTADQFSSLCLGSFRSRAYFDPRLANNTKMINRWITSAVNLLLAGCGYLEKDQATAKAKSTPSPTRIKKSVSS